MTFDVPGSDCSFGPVVSTSQVAVVALVLPAASVLVTVNVWVPSARAASDLAVAQLEGAARSSEHVSTASPGPVNTILADLRLVFAAGTPVRTGAEGAVASTVQLIGVDAALTLPATSVCLTLNVCAPSARRDCFAGFEHDAKEPPSTEQVKVAEGSPEKPIDGVRELLSAAGREVTVGAVGAVTSTTHVAVAARLVLPSVSVCLTATECVPSARSLRVTGELQSP